MKLSRSPSLSVIVLYTFAPNPSLYDGAFVYVPMVSSNSLTPSIFSADPNITGTISHDATAAAICSSLSTCPSPGSWLLSGPFPPLLPSPDSDIFSRTASASCADLSVTSSINLSVLCAAPLKSTAGKSSSSSRELTNSSLLFIAISILFTNTKTGMPLSLSILARVLVWACTPSDPLMTRRA